MSHTIYYGGLAADDHGSTDDRPPLVFLPGLTFDRRQWEPVLRELEVRDAGRRVVSFDLPGHGESVRLDSYDLDDVAAVVHQAVAEAGLDAPTLVGHSISGVLATVYAAAYPARGVVNLDQPMLVGGFADMLRQAEPTLRGPRYEQVWNRLLAGMNVGLLPPAEQKLLRSAPRQDLLLGYWRELLTTPAEEIGARRARDMAAIHSRGIPYHYVTCSEPAPAYRRWLESVAPHVLISVLPGESHFPHLSAPAELAAILAPRPPAPA